MREILFRGKRVDNDEWIIGLFIKDCEIYGYKDEHTYIVTHEHPSSCFGSDIYFEVIPETIGQYTGLTDKNGKKIFEGDIVKYEYKDFRGEKCAIYLDVQYCEMCGFYKPFGDSDDTFASAEVEVIGNVFDNPELLEVK